VSAAGRDEAGLLLVADASGRVHVLPAEGAGWQPDAARTVTLPGLVRGPDDAVPPVSATSVADESGERIRFAWRVGLPGERIDVAQLEMGDDAIGPVSTAIDLDADLVGMVEVAALGRPLLLGDDLVAELIAAADAEHPRPGDRSLVSVRLSPSLSPGLVKRPSFAQTQDIDRIGPVVDLTTPPGLGPQLFAARIASVSPAVIEIDDGGSAHLRTSVAAPIVPALGHIDGPLATIVGAFGSRIVAGWSRQTGALSVVQIDDLGSGAVVDVTPPLEDVGTASGPLVASLLGGAPLMLIPMGADRPAQAILTTSMTASVQPLDALRCDSVALPTSDVANGDAAIRVACLLDGELYLATIRVAG
jgi:hypothetical protein